ncbi:bifunctional DNA-binding transcriptional regulator/O6-methylguanine-DNA methyltransferase Ada [Pseudoroseomonas oryzae]|uniref:Bifunctional DNA-binding transcriptional regulator/O6-methylguanine-DNA methyltransferase Ada n=2 Tax=Teichococcus oryzae TaxID=1608942 RepID=A0A5B2TML5_9PROT|nr:bifunctional DNA-binding transcriptional regulator/O6-methylguanine-DNA methyltransferase Ada [Pseudoroseomonas oryzae]KAA2215255.1 bifunctional DNA-binding transcriptional regulator/O6-methylguanine-DNA methyltransferase Ada [Pseudoroseomonas oryzae]
MPQQDDAVAAPPALPATGSVPGTAADPRWRRILARDATADGQFWYSVVTTGVYCRPSCASRPARPENVRIHDSLAAARATGCRPCRRCRPDEPPKAARDAALVARACRLIEAAEEPPALEALAAALEVSPAHFHRLFRAATGLTPRGYAAAHRARRLRDTLAGSRSVTEAIFSAGFSSSGRFYEAADGLLGMTPGAWRAGGAGQEIRFALGECSLGAILVAATERGLCAILLGDEPEALLRDLQDRFPRARLVGGDAGFEALVAQVVGFVEAPRLGLDLPLDIRGTAFQQRVWQALRAVPAGETVSYTDIARRIGMPAAVRAVAGACAANPLAVAIPCHRVLRQDGALSGYRWGIARKRALLAQERDTGEGRLERIPIGQDRLIG